MTQAHMHTAAICYILVEKVSEDRQAAKWEKIMSIERISWFLHICKSMILQHFMSAPIVFSTSYFTASPSSELPVEYCLD